MTTMHFYIIKTNKNDQAQLLEVPSNNGINSRNVPGIFLSHYIKLF